MWLRIIRWALTVSVALFLAWTAYRDWPSIRELEWRGGLAQAALATAFGVAGFGTLPLGLRLLLRRLGFEGGAFVWRLWLQAFIYKYVPGKVVLVAERIRLGRRLGIDAATSTVLVLWESVMQLLGGCLVIAVTLPWIAEPPDSAPLVLGVGLLAGVLLLFALPRGLRWLERFPIVQRRLGTLSVIRLTAGDIVRLVLIYAASWTFLGLSFYFMCASFFELGAKRIPQIILWYVAAYVFGWVSSIAPAGLGLREGVVVIGLADLLGRGPALAVAAAGRLWITAIEVLCVVASLTIALPPSPEDPAAADQRSRKQP